MAKLLLHFWDCRHCGQTGTVEQRAESPDDRTPYDLCLTVHNANGVDFGVGCEAPNLHVATLERESPQPVQLHLMGVC